MVVGQTGNTEARLWVTMSRLTWCVDSTTLLGKTYAIMAPGIALALGGHKTGHTAIVKRATDFVTSCGVAGTRRGVGFGRSRTTTTAHNGQEAGQGQKE